MKISVIGGAGYVGLITALGASSMGHEVIATDIDEKKVWIEQKMIWLDCI